MFLMADGRPIFGGTYWPREDRKVDDETLPGFKTIIKIVRESWKDDPKATEAQAEKLASATTPRPGKNPLRAVSGGSKTGGRSRGRPQGRIRSGIRRLRLSRPQVSRHQVSAARAGSTSCSASANARRTRSSSAWPR